MKIQKSYLGRLSRSGLLQSFTFILCLTLGLSLFSGLSGCKSNTEQSKPDALEMKEPSKERMAAKAKKEIPSSQRTLEGKVEVVKKKAKLEAEKVKKEVGNAEEEAGKAKSKAKALEEKIKKTKVKLDKKAGFAQYLNKPPSGFVDLLKFIPSIRSDIRYHTPNNFTGSPLPGYGAPGAWMRLKAAKALARVQKILLKKGYGIIVYDAYRPIRGTLGMVAWAKRVRKTHLLKEGYIATRSGHNKGHTIDLSIFSLKTGKLVDMGTPWDSFSKRTHTKNVKGRFLKNRMILVKAMKKGGFRNYWKEWWHFSYKMKAKPIDVPYGCYEAPEGKWKRIEKWDMPGFKMPMTWTPKPCKK